MSRKRGKLSNEEMKFIRENCLELSLDEMAIELNRTTEPIRKYIEKQNIKARDLTDHEHLLATLRARYYYAELQKQIDEGELIFFEHQWIDYFRQFNEDVIHSEEMQIMELIRTEILINRSMEDRQQIMQQIDVLEELIDAEMDKDAASRDTASLAAFQQQLGAAIGSKSSYINEHEKLLTKKEKFLRELKGTREQRKKKHEDSKTNFTVWLRELDEKENAQFAGFDMEVHAIAADKERLRLSEYHTYEDGEVDQPLLNADSIIEDKER